MRRTVMAVAGAAACLALGATAFLAFGLPRWLPAQCARYSPFVDQVIGVYLVHWRPDAEDRGPADVANQRIATEFRARAVPGLMRALTAAGSDVTTKDLAIMALGAIGPEANAAVPVILAGLRSGAIPRDDTESDWLFKALAGMGPSPAWTTALADPDASIGLTAIDFLRRYGGVAGFLTLWRALNSGAVAQSRYLIDHLDEFDYAGFKQRGERLAEVIAGLEAVEARGTEEMSDWASWILYQVQETE